MAPPHSFCSVYEVFFPIDWLGVSDAGFVRSFAMGPISGVSSETPVNHVNYFR